MGSPHLSGSQTGTTAVCSAEWVRRRFPPHRSKTSGITQTDQRGLRAQKRETQRGTVIIIESLCIFIPHQCLCLTSKWSNWPTTPHLNFIKLQSQPRYRLINSENITSSSSRGRQNQVTPPQSPPPHPFQQGGEPSCQFPALHHKQARVWTCHTNVPKLRFVLWFTMMEGEKPCCSGAGFNPTVAIS